MSNSITRFFDAIWSRLPRRTDKKDAKLMNNPEAVRGVYEDLIRDVQSNIHSYKHLIGQFLPIVKQKKNSLKDLTNEIVELKKKMSDANDASKSIAAELQKAGTSETEIEKHPDYARCVTSYNDFHATLEEKNARVTKLEQDIERVQEDIESYKQKITCLTRDREKIKTEQSEAVAELITAREQDEISKMLSGINTVDVAAELAKIQEIRGKGTENTT